ncbi:MAG: MucB/RseB C-terminal domain-containing protein [Candidatus Thiodiazotropha sp. (ex Monitilora ramsayi)]|nr:MucB/RseB C-terminal domain-containing protein [Candidatus Thiodiazotropha sp. (ex Monitilora ramsayi)]
MRQRPVRFYHHPILVLFTALVINHSAWADDDRSAKQWLERMMDAVQQLSYQGTFIYLHDNQLETMRIVHAVEDDRVRESLMSLNGTPREVMRDNDSVTCVLPESRQVSVDRRPPSDKFLNLLPEDLDLLEDHYTFHLLGSSRIANHQAQIVTIVPKDRLRYGYRFFLDEDTGLPLKSDLMNELGEVVEQTMFTDLQVGVAEIRDVYRRTSLYTYQLKNNADAVDTMETGHVSRWDFERLPSGFKLSLKHYLPDPESLEPIEQYVFTDGLGSLSVFVEAGGRTEALSGVSRLGAINAWGGQVEGFQVTAVGEVPPITLLGVVQGMQLKP